MHRIKNFSLTTKFALIVCSLLLIVNFSLGLVLISQSKSTMKTLVNEHMIYISKTAASLIDGDKFDTVTKDTVGSETYNEIMEVLSSFQKNMKSEQDIGDLRYIYAVRQVGSDDFIFVLDPDPDAPASYGDDTVVTNAIHSAANGISAIDFTRLEDEWGSFYTAYSPIFRSDGSVAGMIGADFDAEWYEDQLTQGAASIIVMSIISLSVGALSVLILTRGVRKRFNKLNTELSALSDDVGELANEILSRPEFNELRDLSFSDGDEDGGGASKDPVEMIDRRVKGIRGTVGAYVASLQKQAYMDLMTGTGNRSAYIERIEELEKRISFGDTAFALGVFDVNRLKETNDQFGHDRGDMLIIDTARILKEVFGAENTFRFGGDEFVAVIEDASEAALADAKEAIERMVEAENQQSKYADFKLSLSKGFTMFDPAEDESLATVFHRADEAMYVEKRAYYGASGDRRKPR